MKLLTFTKEDTLEVYQLSDHLEDKFNSLDGLLISLPPFIISVSNQGITNKIIVTAWHSTTWDSMIINAAPPLLALWQSFWVNEYLFTYWYNHRATRALWSVSDTPINITAFYIKLKQEEHCNHSELVEWLNNQFDYAI